MDNDFKATDLIAVGSGILEANILPEELAMSSITNIEMGFDLFLLGMARNQTKEMTLLMKSMSTLEEEIFSEDSMKKMKIYEKINAYNLAKESFKFRYQFLKEVNKSVDWGKLQAKILEVLQSKNNIGQLKDLKDNDELKKKLLGLLTESSKKDTK